MIMITIMTITTIMTMTMTMTTNMAMSTTTTAKRRSDHLEVSGWAHHSQRGKRD